MLKNMFSISIMQALRTSQFGQRLGWMLMGEGATRLTRLLTAIVLARYLTPLEFGIAALILSIDEILKVITRNGIGQKIIQCGHRQLDSVCQRAYQLNWSVHVILFGSQLLIAKPLAMLFSYPELHALLSVLAFAYLIYPFAMVQVNLLQRQQNMKKTSQYLAIQVSTDNVLSAIFAIAGMGVWSIILPKLVVAPLWVFMYRNQVQWRFKKTAAKCAWADIFEYSLQVFGVELLKTLRQQADRLLIGFLLGLDALGIYYFAVNAGSGMSQALIKAYTVVALPDMCHQLRNKSKEQSKHWFRIYLKALTRFFLFVAPLICLQFLAAPWYVPIVFGEHWVHAIPVLMLLCAAMLFQGIIDTGSQIFRASGQVQHDLFINVVNTIAFFVAILLAYSLSSTRENQLFYIAFASLMNTAIFAFLHVLLVKRIMYIAEESNHFLMPSLRTNANMSSLTQKDNYKYYPEVIHD